MAKDLEQLSIANETYDVKDKNAVHKTDAAYIKLLADVSATPSFINDFSFADTTNPIRPFGLDDDCAFSFTVNANSGAVIFPQNSLNNKWFATYEGANAKARLFTTVIRTVAGTTSSSVTREIKNLAGITYFYLAANLSKAYDSHEHVELVFTLEREDASKVYSVTCFLTIRFFYSVTSAENSTAYFTAKTFKKVQSKG